MGRRGSLAAAPSSRPGRAGAASPTRRPRDVRAESRSARHGRDDRRTASPVSLRAREVHGAESLGGIRRGRDRNRAATAGIRRERGPLRGASVAILLDKERHRSASPAVRLGRERRREREGVPASSSTITTRGRPRHRDERHGPRAVRVSPSTRRSSYAPKLASQRGEERPRTGSPPPRRAYQRPRSVGGQVRQRVHSPPGRSLSTPPSASPNAHTAHNSGSLKRQREQDPGTIISGENFIFKLPQELFDDLFRRIRDFELCRLVSTSRFMLRVARSRLQPYIQAPLIGCILVRRGRHQSVITFRNEVQPSVQYIANSLKMLPEGTDIIDCRNGYILLKQHNGFFIWDPFERGRWMEIPQRPSISDNMLAAVLICEGEARQYSLVLLCEFEGLAVLQIFNVKGDQWLRSVTSLSLSVDENVPRPGVHCDHFVYFLTSRERIVRIDLIQVMADIIDLPDSPSPSYSQKILSRINGLLSLSTADVAHVCVAQYQDDEWHLRWKVRAPRAALSIKVVGYAEENGLLLVETGLGKSYVLDVEDADWRQLQPHLSAEIFLPLEMSSPFCYPFPPVKIDGSKFVDNKIGFKKKARRLLIKKDTTEGTRNAIGKLFENQYK